jgi:hypothetical protein
MYAFQFPSKASTMMCVPEYHHSFYEIKISCYNAVSYVQLHVYLRIISFFCFWMKSSIHHHTNKQAMYI